MKAKFSGSYKEFEAFYQHFKLHQSASSEGVVFMFEADPTSEVVQGVEQISFCGGDIDDKADLNENDIFHSNNREWLLGKLAEADEDIQAGRIVPSTKALFDDVITRGRARLKTGGQ